ncbi:hypothetical protein BD324DRAFT_373474 [Kockovaella imperatae]|uniref:Uncharacterized protein n=1 Tax=Kockovaella imperatae TaxID=4999 RepID=A0A1Y1UM84_9TREE|nr:hypothetical protein BD324DRAFT_373474 [Kockovaella imperatae]ORX38637.1 hypothetical protein BD324DRAFT_373474 [Kockovaella imperatae]
MNRDIPRIKYANPRVTIHTWQFTKEPYPRDSIDASNDPQAGLLKVSKRAKEMKKKREKERQAQLEEEALARSEALSEAMKRLGQSPPQATTREARATTGQSSSSSSSSDPISSTLTSSTSSSSSSNNSPTAPSTPSSASSASPSTSTSDTSSDPSSSSSSSASASSSSSSSSSSPSSSTTTTTTTTSTTSPSASSSMLNRTQTVKSPKEYTGIRPDPLELDNGAWRQRFRAAKERQELEPTEIVIEYGESSYRYGFSARGGAATPGSSYANGSLLPR